ncbi:MAG: InlB B-repeat-containing protein, partial [Ilumatobacteraceae bacterium]
YYTGTEVSFSASAYSVGGEVWDLFAFSGDACGDGVPTSCTWTANAMDTAAYATFKIRRALSVTVVGTGGSVAFTTTPRSGGTPCTGASAPGTTCTAYYSDGTSVTLTASPSSGWSFKGWTGCTPSDAAVCSGSADGENSVSALFVPQRTLTLTLTGRGSVSSATAPLGDGESSTCNSSKSAGTYTCLYTFDQGDVIDFTATPRTGWTFDGFSGAGGIACSGSPVICSWTVPSSNKSSTATFSVTANSLTITPTPSNGYITDGDGKSLACGDFGDAVLTTKCSVTYDYEATAHLTATPMNSGYHFASWDGCTTAENAAANTCEVSITEPTEVTATFEKNTYTLTLTKPTHGTIVQTDASGTPLTGLDAFSCTSSSSGNCTKNFLYATDVYLKVIADPGYRFDKWNDDCLDAPAICHVTMPYSLTVSADFLPTSTLTLTVTGQGSVSADSAPLGAGETQTCNAAKAGGTHSCAFTFDEGSTITFTPSPAAAWSFRSFTSPITCVAGTCTWLVGVNDASSTALFLQQKTLTLTITGAGSVTADTHSLTTVAGPSTRVSNAAQAAGPTSCTFTYVDTDVVSFTTSAATGWDFISFGGGISCSDGTCSWTAGTSTAPATALFKQQKTLTLTITGKGSVTASAAPLGVGETQTCDAKDDGSETCAFTYSDQDVLPVPTSDAGGWDFRTFGGAISLVSGNWTWTAGTGADASATFLERTTLLLSITGKGAVIADTVPLGAGQAQTCNAPKNDGASCTFTFSTGDTIGFTAASATDWDFISFGGDIA